MRKLIFLMLIFSSECSFANENVRISNISLKENINFIRYKGVLPEYYIRARIYNLNATPLTGFSGEIVFTDCDKNKNCFVVGKQKITDDTTLMDKDIEWIGAKGDIPPGEARDMLRPVNSLPMAEGNLTFQLYVYPSYDKRYTLEEGLERDSVQRCRDKKAEYDALPSYQKALTKKPTC